MSNTGTRNAIESKWDELVDQYFKPGDFMKPQLNYGRYYIGDSNDGYFICWWDEIEDIRKIHKITLLTKHTGLCARLSASGYMDCTDWTPINSEQDVEDFMEMYGEYRESEGN